MVDRTVSVAEAEEGHTVSEVVVDDKLELVGVHTLCEEEEVVEDDE